MIEQYETHKILKQMRDDDRITQYEYVLVMEAFKEDRDDLERRFEFMYLR